MRPPLTLPDFCYHGFPAPTEAHYIAPACDAPILPPPPDGPYVINVCDFIASADCDPALSPGAKYREAIRRAAETVPDEGGILYFPEGQYEVETHPCLPIAIKSNTWILGSGPGTVIRNLLPGGVIFWIYAVDNVRVSNMTFDINHGVCDPPNESYSRNFATAIATGAGILGTGEIRRSSNIVVENCEFYTSGTAMPGETLHAVLAQGCDGLWIRKNRVRELQIKASGWNGCTRVFIEDNYITDPHNLGISLVVQTADGVLEDAYITGNVIENLPSAGGIFIGTDGEGTDGDVCSRLVVRDNVIRGAFHGLIDSDWNCDGEIEESGLGASVAFIVDVPKHAKDWIFENNIVDNTSSPPGDNTCGIVIQQATECSQLESLIVRGNSIRNVDQAAIRIGVSGRGFIITDNRCEQSRGISVIAGDLGTREVLIANNAITGGASGVYAGTWHGSLEEVLIHDNQLESDPAGGSWWVGVRLETSAGRVLSADVSGNRCRVTGTYSFGTWGIRQEQLAGAGAFGSMRFCDNDLSETATPIGLIGSSAAVAHNLGHQTEARGVGSIAAGATSVDVAHGLSVRPRPEQIQLTATSFPASWSGRGLCWVEIPNDTHLRVRCAVAPAMTAFGFAWRAILR